MKLLRVGPPDRESPAVQINGAVFDVSGLWSDYDQSFWENEGIVDLRRQIKSEPLNLPILELETTRIGPPIPRPGKVVCVGLNYRDHIDESQAATPTEPVLFMKAPNTVVGPNDAVCIPPGSTKTDYEAELAVIIGKTCRYLRSEEAAWDAIGGFTISDDVSERAYQLERGGQWTKGKSCETFNPLGPWLVPRDDVGDPQNLAVLLRVNGELRQRSNTSEMLFSVRYLVWYISQFMVLEPGDVVNTGTPGGVALGRESSAFLSAGDLVEIEIEGLGVQRHVCVDAPPPY